jgi:hypothetical protein
MDLGNYLWFLMVLGGSWQKLAVFSVLKLSWWF